MDLPFVQMWLQSDHGISVPQADDICDWIEHSKPTKKKKKPLQHIEFHAPNVTFDVDNGEYRTADDKFAFTYRHEV